MKNILIVMFIGIVTFVFSQGFPILKDAYFGLTPPGLTPEVFAPGIASDSIWAEHCQVAISPKGDEIFWSAWTADYKTEDGSKNTEQLFYSKIEKGKWTKPKKAEFTKNNKHGLNGGPVFSPDGNRLYFYQVKSPWITSDMNTYYVEKQNGKWSTEPINVGQPYNSKDRNYSPVFTYKGNAYKSSKGIISKYTYENKKFMLVDSLIIHKDFIPKWNIYVSPEEDYVIFAAKHEGGYGDVDLYISFKTKDGNWGYPINMGPEINTELRERFPTVSPDGKYMFFMRHTPGQDFFWVSTDIIEELREQHILHCQKMTNLQHSFADFKLNDQYSDKKSTNQVVLKDLDNDGDLDAVCANMGYNNSQILFNDGKGNFTDSGQELTQQGHGVGIDDLNGDGSPDIFITCAGYMSGNEKEYNNLPSRIYFNNGKGQFQDSDHNLGDKDLSGNAVHLVDIDSDDDIDVVVEYNQSPDILYLNNGKGAFTKSDTIIPENSLFLDLDADGDSDIFCREFGRGYKMLINDRGEFSEYWNVKDSTIVHGAASFGDIDNDKDLDIVLTNGNRQFNSPSKVLLNDGKGYFKDSGQKLSTSIFGRICIGDLNGDKSPDLFITSLGEPSVVWSNDGKGKFTLINSVIGTQSPFQRPVISDLDNDGFNDVFIANFDGGSNQYSNEIWLNQKNRNKSDIGIKENIGVKMQKINENLSYDELQNKVIDFYRKDSLDTAILYMEYAHNKYPEYEIQSLKVLGQIYTKARLYSKAIAVWKDGIDKGYQYNLNKDSYQKYYKDNIEFEKLAKIEKDKMAASHIKHEVLLPENFDSTNQYPVLFIFHGNNRNIEISKSIWTSDILKKRFISVFVQSYFNMTNTTYQWLLKDDKTDKEFKEIYDNILKTYSIDTNNIIFAGMSAGGMKVVDYAFKEIIPMTGLVLNCPVIPSDINEESVKQFVEKKKRIGIITGGKDFALPAQKKLLSDIENLNGKTKMLVNKGLGHEFAEDFSIKLDEYLKWVIKK